MQYNPKTKGLSIAVEDADLAAGYLLSAIRYFRMGHSLPLHGLSREELRERPVPVMEGGDTCEYCILAAAKALGLDLGATRPGEADVREHR